MCPHLQPSPRRLAPTAAPGDVVRLEGQRRPAGRLLAVEGERGLALMRIKTTLEASARGEPCFVEGSGASLTTERPAWWPPTWGHEEVSRDPDPSQMPS